MKVFATAFLLFYLRALNAHNCSLENPCPYGFGEGRPFEQPEQLRSNSSSWEIELHVNITKVEYGWLRLYRRTYNGKIVGPTWHIKKGDNITVRLHNHLSEDGNNIVPDENLFNFPNSTNLHTHGLHISGENPQDNVLVTVKPGQTQTYVYEINSKQASGTNWYHAHLHGSTAFQVQGGLSGILVVDDDDSQSPFELSAVSCPNHCDKDIQMIFQPILEFGGFSGFIGLQSSIKDYEGFRFDGIKLKDGTNLSKWLQDRVNLHTTNGLLKPVLSMTTGQMYRFRMINAGGGTSFTINVTDENGAYSADCNYREIAVDGIYLDKPRVPHMGRSFLTPGQRCDWLIKCNKPGTYKLKSWELEEDILSTGLNGSLVNYGDVLVTLNVSGNVSAKSTKNNFPSLLPERPNYLKDLRNTSEQNISNRFVLEFEGVKVNNIRWSGPTIGHKMKVNAVQEWQVLNSSPLFAHPLHIHVNHFQVIGYNNYTGGVNVGNFTVTQKNSLDNLDKPCNYRDTSDGKIKRNTSVDLLKYLGHDTRYKGNGKDTIGYARIGDFRDTVLVPPLANITIRFTTDLYTGNVIFHCHLLKHEDKGMMMLAKIVPENENIGVAPTHGYLPGVCDECDRFPPNNKTTLCDKNGSSSSSTVIFSFMTMLLSIYAGIGCSQSSI